MRVFNEIRLDRGKKTPIYKQLYYEIKQLITFNKLECDYKLPSIRELSDLLKVNNSTIVSAYKLLEKEGYVYKRAGSGTFVKKIDNDIVDIEFINSDILYDFTNATTDSSLFPIDEFKELMNRVIDRDKGTTFDYQQSIGYLPLRKAIKKQLE